MIRLKRDYSLMNRDGCGEFSRAPEAVSEVAEYIERMWGEGQSALVDRYGLQPALERLEGRAEIEERFEIARTLPNRRFESGARLVEAASRFQGKTKSVECLRIGRVVLKNLLAEANWWLRSGEPIRSSARLKLIAPSKAAVQSGSLCLRREDAFA